MELAPKYLTEERLADIREYQQQTFAKQLAYFLPRESFLSSLDTLDNFDHSYATSPYSKTKKNLYNWIYYPILEEFTYSKGLEKWSMLVVGYLNQQINKILLFEPVQGHYYWCRLNGGLFGRSRKLRVNDKKDSKTLAVGFGNSQAIGITESKSQVKLPQFIIQNSNLIVSSGSAMLDLIDCAAGRLDLFYSSDMQELLPLAVIIIQEAGGTVCSTNGTPINLQKSHLTKEKSLVAGNRRLITAYQDYLKQEHK